jgi:hypothetical protein
MELLRALAGDAGAGEGWGPEPVVALDTLLLFLCLCCAGSLPARLHMAFWALDRGGRGWLGLEQVGGAGRGRAGRLFAGAPQPQPPLPPPGHPPPGRRR